jgi:hypothetical protein
MSKAMEMMQIIKQEKPPYRPKKKNSSLMRIPDPAALKGAFLATPINGLEKTNEFFRVR